MRRRIALAGSLAATLMVGGCGLGNGLYNAPLPGGADLGDHPYKVTVKFADALDLVPQSGVKVNDVAVGRVTKITLERSGKVADVVVQVNGGVHLPANAVASIQQTSLLGEKYVSLAPPLGGAASGVLRNAGTIGISQTTDGVEVEQVFGALSLVLNGGGIGQLHEIAQELNAFSHGHEASIRSFFASVDRVVGALNAHKSAITEALDALAQLSTTLRSNDAQITRVLGSFAPGIAVLAGQRKQLITLLTSLNNLSTVTVQTLDASKQNIVDDLKSLAPILQQLAAAGSSLPRSLQVLATYPFTNGAMQAIMGDYLNAYVKTALNTPGGTIVADTVFPQTTGGTTSGTPALISPPAGLLPATSSAAPGLPSTLSLTPTPTRTSTGTPRGTPTPSPAGSTTSGSASSPGSATSSTPSVPSGSVRPSRPRKSGPTRPRRPTSSGSSASSTVGH